VSGGEGGGRILSGVNEDGRKRVTPVAGRNVFNNKRRMQGTMASALGSKPGTTGGITAAPACQTGVLRTIGLPAILCDLLEQAVQAGGKAYAVLQAVPQHCLPHAVQPCLYAIYHPGEGGRQRPQYLLASALDADFVLLWTWGKKHAGINVLRKWHEGTCMSVGAMFAEVARRDMSVSEQTSKVEADTRYSQQDLL